MTEIKFLLKFGKREHLESLVKGNIYCSNVITFWGIEDKLKIKGQGDILEAGTRMFAQKMIMHNPDTKEIIAEYGKSNGLMRVEPAEKMPVFCMFAVYEEDCKIDNDGTVSINLSDDKKQTIRDHFPNADAVAIIPNPEVFIEDIRNSIGTEIKYSTARQWLQTGGNSLTTSLLGKLLPQTVIFTLVALMCCAALYGFNAFPLNSGWMPMISAIILLVLASQAVGVFMIGVLPTLRLGLSFASLFGMIAFSIVGFSFPVLGMDPTLQALSDLFPLRHYFLIYVDQALNGRDLFYSWSEYVWLAGFLILPFLIGKNLKNALLYFKYIP